MENQSQLPVRLGECPLRSFETKTNERILLHEFIGVAQKICRGNHFCECYFLIVPAQTMIFLRGEYTPQISYPSHIPIQRPVNLEAFLAKARREFPGKETLELQVVYGTRYITINGKVAISSPSSHEYWKNRVTSNHLVGNLSPKT